MFKLIFTAAMAATAFAYTQPVGDSPVGNPIAEPGLNSVVPAGQNFTVVWQPTTPGTVTLVLLKGPSSNAVPQYAIAEKIDNSGTYTWQVASDLAPSENAQGYGIQLIVDSNGQYQYTTQFGISNPNYKAPASYTTSSSAAPKTTSATVWTTYCPEETTFTHGSKTYSVTKATTLTITEDCTTTSTISSKHPVGTGASSGIISKPANVTMVAPTGGYTPTTVATYSKPLTPSAPSTATPTPYKGAASTVVSSFFGLAAAAGLALLAM